MPPLPDPVLDENNGDRPLDSVPLIVGMPPLLSPKPAPTPMLFDRTDAEMPFTGIPVEPAAKPDDRFFIIPPPPNPEPENCELDAILFVDSFMPLPPKPDPVPDENGGDTPPPFDSFPFAIGILPPPLLSPIPAPTPTLDVERCPTPPNPGGDVEVFPINDEDDGVKPEPVPPTLVTMEVVLPPALLLPPNGGPIVFPGPENASDFAVVS